MVSKLEPLRFYSQAADVRNGSTRAAKLLIKIQLAFLYASPLKSQHSIIKKSYVSPCR